jgi:hypothetical protein
MRCFINLIVLGPNSHNSGYDCPWPLSQPSEEGSVRAAMGTYHSPQDLQSRVHSWHSRKIYWIHHILLGYMGLSLCCVCGISTCSSPPVPTPDDSVIVWVYLKILCLWEPRVEAGQSLVVCVCVCVRACVCVSTHTYRFISKTRHGPCKCQSFCTACSSWQMSLCHFDSGFLPAKWGWTSIPCVTEEVITVTLCPWVTDATWLYTLGNSRLQVDSYSVRQDY